MIIYECIVVNSVLYVNDLVVLIVYSCLKTTTTKNIIIYERIIAVLTSKNKSTVYLDVIKIFYLYRSCTKIRLDLRAKKRLRRLSALVRPSSCVALRAGSRARRSGQNGMATHTQLLGGRTVNIILSRSNDSLRA